ncbi:hypothetical protein [Methyloceanibacter sp.]|uniref:hypothetical protein n=1 Tax=Methyloceanibacter sp. TaxID=1965321 RepID=UPI002D2A8812|nr:hypothetical protein [Methyloceanibacter sp.]HZP09133.1 hypothetical protein [Methyloceanibacter sp.]
MHRLATSFILGYHGCDAKVAKRLIEGEPFRKSENDYDWLGPGIYFWEANPKRALSFAREVRGRDPAKVRTPAVVGAVIELGLCLDLASEAGIKQAKAAHAALLELYRKAGTPFPSNQGGPDELLRKLDCAVISQLHKIREQAGQEPIDTVRGIFIEGKPIYPNAGFRAKTHCQVCVCNPLRIKGVFRVSKSELT